MKTPKQYAKDGGARCPVCDSENILGCDTDINDGCVYQNIICNNCRAEWVDVYKLTGYSELEQSKV